MPKQELSAAESQQGITTQPTPRSKEEIRNALTLIESLQAQIMLHKIVAMSNEDHVTVAMLETENMSLEVAKTSIKWTVGWVDQLFNYNIVATYMQNAQSGKP